ncbi:MAG: exonuclease domain-containing protein [Herbaspirillum sp.]|uniref:3'-5' exonuclease n=1 Tax=Herbaspirillum sp. TaxID=1890675 RepID=UPI0025841F8E|nr:3'-5' exonuclease [Herbaspirillum sp.]MCP3655429.1 exonuclease domain-containing protein [Herbaspirillum sp.]MCP3945199.1 exonuclease domain-containing protein [Herbaspirillum sp.]MCP4034285.1 exonuclease domain-containing protein [Herbaspirillum sp.]MCP4034290.1 exonuclease domain-containing protein [Herbaspirillum sp.]
MKQLYLIVDLEATCSDDGSISAEEMETIEIGACWVDREGQVIDQFQTFVRPTTNVVLTPFCTELTGIQQGDVEKADPFSVAARSLSEFAKQRLSPDVFWLSWGMYDRRQITRESLASNIEDPLPFAHQNAKRLFAKTQKIGKEVGMVRACTLAKLELKGAHHRALDDAKNIARLLPWILADKKLGDVSGEY